MDINKKLAKLKPADFERWFKALSIDHTGLDWKKEYKKIGGKIEPVSTRKKSPED